MKNYARICGRLESNFHRKYVCQEMVYYAAKLVIPRESGASDHIMIHAKKSDVDQEIMKVGCNLYVSGMVCSFYSKEDGKHRPSYYVMAGDLIPVKDPVTEYTNEVYLDGVVCTPPVRKIVNGGHFLTEMKIRVTRGKGKWDEIPCVFFKGLAVEAGRLGAGRRAEVWGRIQSRPCRRRGESGRKTQRDTVEIAANMFSTDNR